MVAAGLIRPSSLSRPAGRIEQKCRRPERAHTLEKITGIVTVEAPDRFSAVAVALAVVSEALRRPAALSSR